MEKAGILLGESYPFSVVDHATASLGALEAFKQPRNQMGLKPSHR